MDVLNTDNISMDDNFFYLGGDSIMAMKLAGFASELGVQLWVEGIFKFPVLSALARALKITSKLMREVCPLELLGNYELQQEVLEAAEQDLEVSRDDIEDIYPCTALQEGMSALALMSKGKNHAMYVSQSVFNIHNDIDFSRFRAAWEATAKRNPILRTRVLS